MKQPYNLTIDWWWACQEESRVISTFKTKNRYSDIQTRSVLTTNFNRISFHYSSHSLHWWMGSQWTQYQGHVGDIVSVLHVLPVVLHWSCLPEFGTWKQNDRLLLFGLGTRRFPQMGWHKITCESEWLTKSKRVLQQNELKVTNWPNKTARLTRILFWISSFPWSQSL